MIIEILRGKSSLKSTIGKLYIDGVFECYTLEDVQREIKVHGCTAIPLGSYKTIITLSNRFKRELPLLVDVKGFEGVRIHAGNVAEDTEGCVLVGDTFGVDRVGFSRVAFARLFAKMQAEKEITINIRAA